MFKRKHHRWLLPVVLLIWLGVGFRFLETEASPQLTEVRALAISQTNTAPSPFQFELSLPYRDPFLEKRERVVNKKTRIAKPAVSVLPVLRYLGSVQSSRQAVGLVQMKDQQIYQVRAGHSLLGMKILNVAPKRLVLRFQGTVHTIKLKKG